MTREEAIKALNDLCEVRKKYVVMATMKYEIEALNMAIKALEQEPKYCDRNICIKNEYNGISCDECEVTKSQEPKTGHWIRWYERKENDWVVENIPHCKCSECGKEYDSHSSQFIKYCSECGAKMVESQESEE